MKILFFVFIAYFGVFYISGDTHDIENIRFNIYRNL